MSWTTDKTAIVNILKELGYKELEGNLDLTSEAPASFSNKSFTFKPLGLNTQFQTSQAQLNEVRGELVIVYVSRDNSAFDVNLEAFNAALTAIKSYHLGYDGQPEYKRIETKNFGSYGRVVLITGVEQC